MSAQLSRSSRQLLKLSLATPRPCHCGGCICLTHHERRAFRRVARIVHKWKRQVRREARRQARSPAPAA